MYRRHFLRAAAAIAPLATGAFRRGMAAAGAEAAPPAARSRPGQADWPSEENWQALNQAVGGRLLRPESPFAHCDGPAAANCREALREIKNPYYLGDQPALTQVSGWQDAWVSQPSAYAVAAETTADVLAAVNFARDHHLRLVVRGGGHSYQGTSCAPDSLLVWTRRMNAVTLHEAFVAEGCAARQRPQPAVTVGAGAVWMDAYDAVSTRGGRYVQGGGCATVGVAGLIQSGGFGSFSKNYGTAAGGLLEAEIVTADGAVRIANECTHPDLFWALKGGGGGSFGILTRLTLRTRELPEFFGAVSLTIRASSDDAFRKLIAKAVSFYHEALFNPHWGEQMIFRRSNTLGVSMLFQGLSSQAAEGIWRPFLDWVRADPAYALGKDVQILSAPARHLWDAEFLRQHAPAAVVADDRPGASPRHVFWADDRGQCGSFLHAYKSAWLPASLLRPERQRALVDALFASTRHWGVSLHFNKGLAGAPPEAIAAAARTATNPDVLGAFALAIIASEGPPAFPGMPGVKPDVSTARAEALAIGKSMQELKRAAPGAGSYVSESDYFESAWQRSFWGANYRQLARVKRKYDPDGLFIVHHGVGSERWSADGFERLRA